ncbi:MAG TPA: peptidylprolyl isomerase [Solirubrobacterales bacterium]|nr:peptidylprolyl isomerase [Solirubrobacterales bacterium]
MARRTFIAALLVAAALASAACGNDDDGDGGEESSGLPEGCTEAEAPPAKDQRFERSGQRFEGPASAGVTTNCGSFTIELDTARAPKTTASFAGLVEQGLYDDTLIHRIEPGFVVQGGDPLGDGTGGPGYFVDEPPPQDLTYERGVVAMAKTAAEPPGRSGSQFFVVTAPADAGLPPDYALLGRVSEGIETIERIEGLVGPDGQQSGIAVIQAIRLDEG